MTPTVVMTIVAVTAFIAIILVIVLLLLLALRVHHPGMLAVSSRIVFHLFLYHRL